MWYRMKKLINIFMRKKILLIGLGLLFGELTNAQSVYPGQDHRKQPQPAQADIQACSFDLEDVKLLPSIFKENRERDAAWRLSLEGPGLLQSFRNTAGAFLSRE